MRLCGFGAMRGRGIVGGDTACLRVVAHHTRALGGWVILPPPRALPVVSALTPGTEQPPPPHPPHTGCTDTQAALKTRVA